MNSPNKLVQSQQEFLEQEDAGRQTSLPIYALLQACRAHYDVILWVTGFFLFVALIYLWVAPRDYTASAMLGPSPTPIGQQTTQGGGISSLLQAFGGGNASGLPPFQQFTASVASVQLAERLQRKPGVMQQVFKRDWDPQRKIWRPSGLKYYLFVLPLSTLFGQEAWHQPDAVALAHYIDLNVNIHQLDATVPIYEISYTSEDRDFSRTFLQDVVTELDASIREQYTQRLDEYIDYLNKKLESTTAAELRSSLADLMVQQIQQRMSISADLPFAALATDDVSVSVWPSWPKPVIVMPVALLLGLMFGACGAYYEARNPGRMRAFGRGLLNRLRLRRTARIQTAGESKVS